MSRDNLPQFLDAERPIGIPMNHTMAVCTDHRHVCGRIYKRPGAIEPLAPGSRHNQHFPLTNRNTMQYIFTIW